MELVTCLGYFLILFFTVASDTGTYEPDRVDYLPGVPFEYSFGQFTGFLNASNDRYQHYLHYWLIESQGNPDTDPVAVWLSGGPGFSSINSALWIMGPFHVNRDGETLFENVFAWNKAANLLAIESPVGVGWSYAVDGNITTTDEQTRDDCFRALVDFYAKFPKYLKNQLYITGLSYAGVYIPMLAAKVVTERNAKHFPVDLTVNKRCTGIAIENGWFSHRFYKSSVLHYLYYHGIIGMDEWQELISTCCPTNNNSEECDFYAHVTPCAMAPEDESDGTPCGNLVQFYSDDWLSTTLVDTENIYQDCYESPNFGSKVEKLHPNTKRKLRQSRQKRVDGKQPVSLFAAGDDTARKLNYDSTDQLVGYPCWKDAYPWMNLPDVKRAMHITDDQMNQTWYPANSDDFYYTTQYEMDPYFETIIQNSSTRILIYNGDVDTECDFMMAQKFIRAVVQQNNMMKTKKRQTWRYRGQVAGYWERFAEPNGDSRLDLMTVKGSGHYSPVSRSGPTLQMIVNFFLNSNHYSLPIPNKISTTLRPLILNSTTPTATTSTTLTSATTSIPKFSQTTTRARTRATTTTPTITRTATASVSTTTTTTTITQTTTNHSAYEPDRVDYLPGVIFDYFFGQFTGFLNASNDRYQHFLHYWLIESQGNPDTDPVVVWLSGGPGSSSINSALWMVGPFHVNKDGETLFENVYAWNKAANLLIIESPAGVGWSYAVDGNVTTTDEQARDDCFRALVDFYAKFPKYLSNQFYISGLSYAGVYIPMLAAKVVTERNAGHFPVDLTGIAIENGWFSHRFYKSSVLHYLYYHGIIGMDEWQELISTCCPTNNNSEECDFYAHVTPCVWAPADESDGTPCGDLVEFYTDDWLSTTLIDTYNIYQDCYESPNFGSKIEKMHHETKRKLKQLHRKNTERKKISSFYSTDDDTARKFNYDSTDQLVGFPCWEDSYPWMNLPEVKRAMHITDDQMNQTWYPANSDDFYYITQNEMDPYFETIIQNSSTRILIYNGDIDTECDFMMAQKFIRAVVQQNNMIKTMKRRPWLYRDQIAGYWEQFTEQNGDTRLDLMTVKGSGHFSPASRPGPTLQMIVNFFLNTNNYTMPIPDKISTTLRPLKQDSTTVTATTSTTLTSATTTSIISETTTRTRTRTTTTTPTTTGKATTPTAITSIILTSATTTSTTFKITAAASSSMTSMSSMTTVRTTRSTTSTSATTTTATFPQTTASDLLSVTPTTTSTTINLTQPTTSTPTIPLTSTIILTSVTSTTAPTATSSPVLTIVTSTTRTVPQTTTSISNTTTSTTTLTTTARASNVQMVSILLIFYMSCSLFVLLQN